MLLVSCRRPHRRPAIIHSHTMATTYHEYKDKDQFLYITYSGENVFGGGWGGLSDT